MTGPLVVGIDCGTQSAKVTIFDATGLAVARGQQALRPMSRPRPGVAVHPDDDLWTAIAAASQRALAAFDGDVADIVAVGLCPIRCCKAFLRADGSLAEPVISWMDDRAYQPYQPDDASVRYATTASGYLTHRFTGEFKDTAANTIELQWPIDTDSWQWSVDSERYSRCGVERHQLFDLVMPGDVVGALTPEAATATGLPVGVAVVATANDKAVEMLGAGTLDPTTVFISLGTYITAMVHGPTNHGVATNFWTNFACVPQRYLYESTGVRHGMATLSWFLDLLGPELTDHARSVGLGREEYLEAEAAQVPAGSDGLLTVLDWLAPTEAPFRKGSMLGFDARHTRGHVHRSILEAIALTMKRNVDAMCAEVGSDVGEIVVSGGGSASPLFMRIFADVFALPTMRSAASGGAGLGAAMCAAAAAGVHPDIETACRHMTRPRETFAPDPAHTAVYRQIIDLIPHVRDATDPLYERTFPIFHRNLTAEEPQP